jgi:hypothetical protein
MTYSLLAAIPAALLTAMFLYERRSGGVPCRARAARSTLDNALRGRR